MADSIRERIVQDVVTVLNTSRPAGVPQFKRSYGYGIPPGDMPFNAVYRKGRDSHEPVGGKLGPLRKRTCQIWITCWAKTDPADMSKPADQLVDASVKWVFKALEGLSKAVNAGQLYHMLLVTEGEIDYEQADYLYVKESVVITAEYQSKTGDLETWA